jgi:hypothetical protein
MFCTVTLYNLVESYRIFGGKHSFHIQSRRLRLTVMLALTCLYKWRHIQ